MYSDKDNFLLKKIYNYYPKDCSAFSEEFDRTPETILKLKTINSTKADFETRWKNLMHSLQEKITGYSFSDESPIYDREFCNYSIYLLCEEDLLFRMHLLVSVLHPVHCILISGYRPINDDLSIIGDFEYVEKNSNLIETQLSRIKKEFSIVDHVIKENIGTQLVKMEELKSTIVPHIEIEDKKMGEVNLFDCLFTTFMLAY